jgi:membrane-associated phospholipid phosphatase
MKSLLALYRRSFVARLVAGFLGACALLTILGFFTTNSHLFIPHFDDVIARSVQSVASPALTSFLRVFTHLGSTVTLTAIGVVVIAIFLYMRRLDYIGLLLLAAIGQGALQYGFKTLFERQRPQPLFDYVIGDTPSFPSGHALASTCFFGLLAYLLTRQVASGAQRAAIWAAAVAIILIVGFSRIYFDVHFPSDVIAGYLAGIIWTASVASGAK